MTDEKNLLDKIRDGEPGWQEELKDACKKYGLSPGDYDGDPMPMIESSYEGIELKYDPNTEPIVHYHLDENAIEDAIVISQSVANILCKDIKMEKIPAYRKTLKRQKNRHSLYEKRRKLGKKL